MESRADQIERENRNLRAFRRQADDISCLILNTDLPWVDIEIRIEKLRQEARRLFPQRMDLFERVYERRFQRLWRQWREGGEPDPDEPGRAEAGFGAGKAPEFPA
ncbi:MAG: hypothetical protein QME60_02080 [Verrucomicrobiota bacterium]|nr:hypothetical protein [Verrucomicrobiota bacterium]